LILPKTKGPEGVLIANKLCSRVSQSDEFKTYLLTISIGIAELKESDTIESLLSRTDKALYKAKDAGKDQAVLQE
jgi:diguanylate cyclase (GGDEF)-like protein